MGEEDRGPPLSRRVPNENRGHKPSARVGPLQLPDEVLERMRAAVRAGAQESAAPQVATASPEAAAETADPAADRKPGASRAARRRTAQAARQAEEARQADEDRRAEESRRAEAAREWQAAESARQERSAAEQAAAVSPLQQVRDEDNGALSQVPDAPKDAAPHPLELPLALAPDPDSDAITEQFPAIAPAAQAPARPVRADRAPARAAHPARAGNAAQAAQHAGNAASAATLRQPHPAGRRYRVAAAAAVGVAIVAAGVTAHTLLEPAAAVSSTTAQVLSHEAATRGVAAAWIASQLSRTTIISCDPVMCGALESHGFPASNLLKLKPGSSPSGSTVIVATATIRKQLGGRLGSVYAPAVIARFSSGDQQIDVRAIAQHGAAAYESALSADLRQRQESGAELLSSNRIVVSAAARAQLSGGQVDSRMLVTLAALAALYPIDIVAFADGAPGADFRVSPLRSAELQPSPNAPQVASATFMHSMLVFLRTQLPPFAVSSAQPVRLTGGRTVLRLAFSAPSLPGLLGGPAPPGG